MFPDLLQACRPGLSAAQIAILELHYELLVRWNRTLNLTKIIDVEEAVERHYCESLFVGEALDSTPQSIVDIGSGPGFPGFPIAVLRPDCTVTLVESHKRKAVFLKEASRNLPNVRVLPLRAEDVHERFDVVVSRAVSYEDLAGNLVRLAPKALLLTGVEDPPGDLGYVWQVPMALPWGSQRFLRVGCHVESAFVDVPPASGS